MGIVEPQRDVVKAIVPENRFREMHPHGIENYCCGGGSGFAIMSGHNFPTGVIISPAGANSGRS